MLEFLLLKIIILIVKKEILILATKSIIVAILRVTVVPNAHKKGNDHAPRGRHSRFQTIYLPLIYITVRPKQTYRSDGETLRADDRERNCLRASNIR